MEARISQTLMGGIGDSVSLLLPLNNDLLSASDGDLSEARIGQTLMEGISDSVSFLLPLNNDLLSASDGDLSEARIDQTLMAGIGDSVSLLLPSNNDLLSASDGDLSEARIGQTLMVGISDLVSLLLPLNDDLLSASNRDLLEARIDQTLMAGIGDSVSEAVMLSCVMKKKLKNWMARIRHWENRKKRHAKELSSCLPTPSCNHFELEPLSALWLMLGNLPGDLSPNFLDTLLAILPGDSLAVLLDASPAFFQETDICLPWGAAVGLLDGGMAVGVPEGRVPDGTAVRVLEVAAVGVPEGAAVGVPEGAAVGAMTAEIEISHHISGCKAIEEDVKYPVGNDMIAEIDYEADDLDHVENDHNSEGLSWYEGLRLSNIAWNEERLKMLGLNMKEYSSTAEFTKKKKQHRQC